jgi:ferredoxin-type protein NapG
MSKAKPDKGKDSGPSLGRRNFLRQSVVSVGVTVKEYLKHQKASPEPKPTAPTIERKDWLRPPGAVEEVDFLERCTKCGDCLEACPYEAIVHNSQDDTPVIFQETSPCRLCEDFPCIDACETEALLPVNSPRDIQMGLAVVMHQDCTADQGCNACVSKCPTQAISMNFSNFRVMIDEQGCVGCGICQHICHSVNDRVAIKVVPAWMTSSRV